MEVCGSDSLLCKQDWPGIRWLGMLGETGRWVKGPIRGSGNFLAYGSPASASPSTAAATATVAAATATAAAMTKKETR